MDPLGGPADQADPHQGQNQNAQQPQPGLRIRRAVRGHGHQDLVEETLDHQGRRQLRRGGDQGGDGQDRHLPPVRDHVAPDAQERRPLADAGGADPVPLRQQARALLAPEALQAGVDEEGLAGRAAAPAPGPPRRTSRPWTACRGSTRWARSGARSPAVRRRRGFRCAPAQLPPGGSTRRRRGRGRRRRRCAPTDAAQPAPAVEPSARLQVGVDLDQGLLPAQGVQDTGLHPGRGGLDQTGGPGGHGAGKVRSPEAGRVGEAAPAGPGPSGPAGAVEGG